MINEGDAEQPDTAGSLALVVPPRLRWLSDVIWRTTVLVAAALLIAAVLWKLKIVVLPVFIALLLCTALTGPVVWLEKKGWPSALAAASVFISFLVVLSGILFLIVPRAVDGVGGLGDQATKSVNELGDWFVDGPLGLDREEVDKYTSDPARQGIKLLENSSLNIGSGVKLISETLVGALLSLVFTFFFLKDGRKFQQMAIDRLHHRQRLVVKRAAARAWSTFGGYLRGSAILGSLEGVLMGGTVWIVGGPLPLTIGVISFFGAFFPLIGAIVAGGLAVLVTFATVGGLPAVIVLVVAILTHQLDGNLLGPWIFGHALDLHPVIVLLVLTAGGSVGGIVGAFVAVPITGAISGAVDEFWKARTVIDAMGSPDESNHKGELELPGDLEVP